MAAAAVAEVIRFHRRAKVQTVADFLVTSEVGRGYLQDVVGAGLAQSTEQHTSVGSGLAQSTEEHTSVFGPVDRRST
jgi:hypothetical protein